MNRPSDIEKLSSDKRLAWRALSTLGAQLPLMDAALSVEEAPLATGMPTAAFRAYADELGVLFQIVDDILDVTGTDDALGKPQGSDERHGKRTYVTHFGLDGARDLARECHAAARASLRDAAADGAPELEQITDFILTRTA